jgi:hypothetical protein
MEMLFSVWFEKGRIDHFVFQGLLLIQCDWDNSPDKAGLLPRRLWFPPSMKYFKIFSMLISEEL